MKKRNARRDRREFKRIKSKCVIFCKVDSPAKAALTIKSREFNGVMIDLGEGGIGFYTMDKIPTSILTSNKFVMIDEKKAARKIPLRLIETQGRTCYSINWGQDAFRTGLQFTKISATDRSFIRKLQKLKERKTRKH